MIVSVLVTKKHKYCFCNINLFNAAYSVLLRTNVNLTNFLCSANFQTTRAFSHQSEGERRASPKQNGGGCKLSNFKTFFHAPPSNKRPNYRAITLKTNLNFLFQPHPPAICIITQSNYRVSRIPRRHVVSHCLLFGAPRVRSPLCPIFRGKNQRLAPPMTNGPPPPISGTARVHHGRL